MVERTSGSAAHRWLWKRVSSPSRPATFSPRLSRIVDPPSDREIAERCLRDPVFRPFSSRVPTREIAPERGERFRRVPLKCIVHSKIARGEGGGGGGDTSPAGPGTGYRRRDIDGDGVDEAARARVKEGDRYLHAAWPRVARDGTSTA